LYLCIIELFIYIYLLFKMSFNKLISFQVYNNDKNNNLSYEIKILEKPVNICYLGAGYVGGTSGSVMAYKCPEDMVKVTICDTFEEKIKEWNSDKVCILN